MGRAMSMMHWTQNMVVEVLVRAKLMREAYYSQHALVLQRAVRKWRGLEVKPILRFRKAVTVLQSRHRRRQTAIQVAYFRMLVGTRLKRFAHTQVALQPDEEGRLTRWRDILPDEDVAALKLVKMVHLSGMSSAQREELGAAVSRIQAMVKFQCHVRRAEDIQRIWRGHLARLDLQRRQQSAIPIQAVWRAKIARNRLRRRRAAPTSIQAHVRRMLTMNERRRHQEEQLAEAFAAITDLGDEVVDGRRVRPGGSVSN